MTKTPSTNRNARLRELALLFLRLGATSFGGPAAHVALMEDEVVRRRQWLTRQEFLDLVGATNLIPGPNSTELAIHIGHRRAGWPGLLVAGLCFILPAVCVVMLIAWSYAKFGTLPATQGLLHGVKPVIIAVVLQALWGLGRAALKGVWLGGVAVVIAALSLAGANELLLLLGAGTVTLLRGGWSMRSQGRVACAAPLLGVAVLPAGTAAVAKAFSAPALFLFFLKVGSVLYGSGYVLLAFLRADLVERWGWLTESQLLDAVAVGQFTPGPVFTTATFIGYVLGGPGAALLATVGIFLPAFVFVAVSGPLVPRLRRSTLAAAFLDGVNAASLALMAVVTGQLGVAALVDGWAVLLALVALVCLLRWRVNSAWLVLGGAVVGVLLR